MPPSKPTARPIRDLPPLDIGGIVARQGFAFQDHVAAMFCLQMLLGNQLLEVWCETYDDIVLIWQGAPSEIVEFVQAKKIDLNQLWSPARLCQRTNGVAGTSIIEKSLIRDCCTEQVHFRLFTSLPVNRTLEPLTLPVDHNDRDPRKESMKALIADVRGRIDPFMSANGHGPDFWIANAQWESASDQALSDRNKILLHQFLDATHLPAYVDTVGDLYNALLWKVKAAAETDWRDKDRKMIRKRNLSEWLIAKARPFPNLKPEGRLELKLRQAGMDSVAIESAKDIRRRYALEMRRPQYLDATSSSYFNDQVPAVLHRLRTELDSGRRQENGLAFHQTCVDSVLAIPDNHPFKHGAKPRDTFLLGCIYEVTARCRHRFTLPNL